MTDEQLKVEIIKKLKEHKICWFEMLANDLFELFKKYKGGEK